MIEVGKLGTELVRHFQRLCTVSHHRWPETIATWISGQQKYVEKLDD